jgi:hypothetical protein
MVPAEPVPQDRQAVGDRIQWHDQECPTCSTRRSYFSPKCAEAYVLEKAWQSMYDRDVLAWEAAHEEVTVNG